MRLDEWFRFRGLSVGMVLRGLRFRADGSLPSYWIEVPWPERREVCLWDGPEVEVHPFTALTFPS